MARGRNSPAGRVCWVLALAGLWLPMVQLASSRSVSLHQSSNTSESQGEVKSIELKASAVSSCSSSSCEHGFCPYRQCACNAGYTGSNCDQVPSTCIGDFDCFFGIHGHCSDYKCVCRSGYTGRTCSQIVQSCSPSTCIHGLCPYRQCICYEGYTGSNCDEELRLRFLKYPALQPHWCGAGAGRKNERSLVQRTQSSFIVHARVRALSRSEASDRLLCSARTRVAISPVQSA
ncbi:hypothetical protein NDU88_000868 [Pleurodeles waltl]|uniref:EGF-like domain-containing protein n=1 Tax=Pleurodeles waltl TaxID=8319 RepID=A0AAV7SYA4_PLEWA|nr:hypothetical protein NDU88_000868 [Pleurodeles waltl]